MKHQKSKSISIIFLADLHFGSRRDNANIYESLQKCVYPYISDTVPDLIVIGGDATDDRISFDQLAARYYLRFLEDITSFKRYDKPNGCIPVRFIAGTESHEKGQLQALQFLTNNSGIDVKTFETVGEETICGCRMLYIPEESVNDKKQYYSSTVFNDGKAYDFVFGHGMFSFIGNNGWGVKERSLKGSPVWNAAEFEDKVRAGVFFGHIHIRQNYKDLIYYPGSLTRFCHGEEEPKGFYAIQYNPENGLKNVDFIENTWAYKYETIVLNGEDVEKDNPKDTIDSILMHKNASAAYSLRVRISNANKMSSNTQVVQQYFLQEGRGLGVTIELQSAVPNVGVSDIVKDGVVEHEVPEFAKGITNPEDWQYNTVQYAKARYGKDISREQIQNMLMKCNSFGR